MKVVRTFLGIQQRELAQILRRDAGYISRLEAGLPVRNVKTIEALAAAMGIEASLLTADHIRLDRHGRVRVGR